MFQNRKFVEKLGSTVVLTIGFFLLCNTMAGASRKPNWYAQAEFYSTNYPNHTNNEKSTMLVSDMKKSNESFEIVKKYYETELVYIYKGGVRIWPPHDCMVEKYENLKFLNRKMIIYKEGNIFIREAEN